MLIKPKRLQRGDTVAIVSLSAGIIGDEWAIHKLDIARKRFEEDYGLKVLTMRNTLKGSKFLYEHPEARAADLMEAFRNKAVKGIFCDVGGDDTIRLLPHIDFDVIRRNPKIFCGFSDTTSNHFMMYKAGLISYYGASVMNNIAEYVKINDYTAGMIWNTLFEPKETLDITSSPYYYDEEDGRIWWKEENMHVLKQYHPEEIGYEMLQGSGVVEGELLGGCLDVFVEIMGTSIWPTKEEWRGKIMFLETSEENMEPRYLVWILRALAAQGLFDVIEGIIVGKPAYRSRYEAYKEAILRVVAGEARRPDLPILYNVNFGHAEPIGIIPYGVKARLDANHKTLTLLEPATAD